MVQKLSEKLNCSLRVGVGKIYRRFDMLAASYEESLKALRYLQGTGVMHFMDITARTTEVGSEYPEYKEKLLLQKVSAGDIAESVNAFGCIFDWLVQEYRDQPLKIKNKLLEIAATETSTRGMTTRTTAGRWWWIWIGATAAGHAWQRAAPRTTCRS
jgi:two-component system response regulator YesN